ncbi:GGDEF domain-containing protein [Sphaerochaeta sp. PS]|uniref:GGDEF domain-containing protein n=1 Tax=Sphaerochaeta sp. PS TaxID=3076336 RepID=UPI0028A54DA2|nr:GGDEF domain-containing protein [Sphaerochaeta sp. PS]MDT4761674.1 GGDEF domain-containing protein [Sphaerochaeta sp. PS]
MPLLYYIQNSTISIALIAIMLFYVLGQGGKRQAQDALFIALLCCAFSILVFEFSIDLLTGRLFPGSRILLYFVVLCLYMGNPVLGALYLLYLDQLRNRWVRIPHKLLLFAFGPTLICLVLCLLSLSNGQIFSVDAVGVYHRGPYFYLITLIAYASMSMGFGYSLFFRKSFSDHDFSLFLFFPFPIIIGSLMQLFFEGLEVAGISMVLTLLVVFLHMQNSHANKDYLTLLYNRNLCEQYLHYLIHHRKGDKRICGILMDINHFKMVNDTYGHEYGDKALRLLSQLLVACFKDHWFIGRYGGDEFLLIGDGLTFLQMESSLANFEEKLAQFNAKKLLPFAVSLCMGTGFYDTLDTADAPSFIKMLDSRMYEAKRVHHAKLGQGDHFPG